MIYVDVRGRMGNQLFQYAFARSIQEITQQKICLSNYNLIKDHKDFAYSLDKLQLNENVIHSKCKLPWYANINGPVIKIFRHFLPRTTFWILKQFGVYILYSLKYVPFKIRNHKNYYIVGVWQCERYFNNIKTDIKKEITPKLLLKKKNELLYKRIIETESVCVSIRRGDYVDNNRIKKEFFLCDKNYFQEAIKMIARDIPNATLFLFSDDVEWAKSEIDFDGDIYAEDGIDSAEEKLYLMSMCKHFVISNSSFSWWAQYLSENGCKRVYAPSRWLPKHKSTRDCDIYCDNWILIEV